MDWTKIAQTLAESLASGAGVALVALVAYLAPQLHHLLEVELGVATAKQIENGLALGVRMAETATGLTTDESRLAFAVKVAQGFFDAHHVELDAGTIGSRVEASLLAAKMAGLASVRAEQAAHAALTPAWTRPPLILGGGASAPSSPQPN